MHVRRFLHDVSTHDGEKNYADFGEKTEIK